MRNYSQEEIERLIGCAKKISAPPRKEMRLDQTNWRNDMELESKDGEFKFSVFMRRNDAFPENFSIGLRYHPKDEPGTIVLLRCNGPHGELEGSEGFPLHHPYPHVHRARAENIAAGDRPERGAERTDRYVSFEEALPFFLRVTNVENAHEYFATSTQMKIDFGEEAKK